MSKCESNPRTCTIVAGDFNAPGIDWESSTVKPDAPLKGMCERLLGLLNEHHFSQLVTEPLHVIKGYVLDLFCTNKPGLIRNISLVPGISDHDRVIVVDTHLKALINKKPRRQIPLWSKAKWDELENLTNEFNQEFSETSATRNIHENWNKFKDHDKLLQDKIPSKLSSTRYNLSWFDSDLKRLNRKKRRVYNKAIIAQTCLRSREPGHILRSQKKKN